jgi:hypothetical protein
MSFGEDDDDTMEGAEITVTLAYLQLPLLPPQPDGARMARLKRVQCFELRLIERGGPDQGMVLIVELFDTSGHQVIAQRTCEDLQEATAAYLLLRQAMKAA